MFNSPAPRATPRRTALRPRETMSRGTPSIYSERASERERVEPGTPSARSSRLAISRASPTSTAGETMRTVRADDQGGEKVYWARNERVAISSAGQLPREVQALVKDSDLATQPVSGHLDLESGFALVTTSDGCVAWNFRTQSSPTCYPFPAPPLSRPQSGVTPPVLAALYASSNTGEPGVILLSPTGELRFWDSMSLALANVERYQVVQLELGSDDYAERIWHVEGNVFVITTTTSLAFRLTIVSQGGRLVPSVALLTRPGGMFGRASTILFNAREDREGITAVTMEGGNVYMLAGRTVQKWVIGPDGHKVFFNVRNIPTEAKRGQFIQDSELYDAVGNALFEDRWSSGNITLELSDLVGLGQNELAALVSFAESESGSSGHAQSQHSRAIVVLSSHPRSGALVVSRIIPVAYTALNDARMLDVPRLLIPYGSSTAFIRFPTDVVMVSIADDDPHEDTISLKDPSRNAFIGVGCLSSHAPSKRFSSPSFLLMPATGGLLALETFTPSSSSSASSAAIATARLKSRVEQAVFYGDRSDNPLSFDLSPDYRGDAAEAAEAVSQEILSSSSEYMPAIYELRPALSDRLLRLKELIGFLRKNGLLRRLPQDTRRRLCRDAEKAKAAIDLWEYQNRVMDQMHTRSPQSLLSDSILAFMNQVDHAGEDDLVRQFFRTRVQHLDQLLDIVFSTFRAALASSEKRDDLSPWVLEANRIFIIVLRAASQYRETDLYEVDRERPAIELWTASDVMIDALESLYSATERLIRDRTRDFGSVIDEPPSQAASPELRRKQVDQSTLKTQMTDLAAALCSNMEDKMRAASRRQLEDGADQQEGIALHDRWEAMKPRVIRPLVSIDRIEPAYELAEHHRDFPTLVWLCHDAVAGSGAARLQGYIEKFGEEFAFVLYQWYIDQRQFHALLTQDEVYGALVSKFFRDPSTGGKATAQYPELAWIHDIACKRYGDAAEALLAVNGDRADRSQKQLISSIGKLAAVANIKIKGDSSQRKRVLIALDDELDLIAVQDALRDSLLSVAPPLRSTQTPLEAYVAAHLSNLRDRPAFRQLFVSLAQRVVAGEALEIEDLVDVLTLKDNRSEKGGDGAVALDRLVRDSELPEGRKQVALLSVWRRVFVRDDWISIANTSGRSEEAQRQMLRRTLAYETMRAINGLEDFPRNFVLSPFTASQSPLPAELAARFPEWSTGEIEQLMKDHEDEIALLERYIGEAGLEERVKEVAELVRRDVENGWEEDVQM